MELLKLLYFLVLAFCIADSLFAGKNKLNWIFVLTALLIHAIYFFGITGVIFLIISGIISTVAELISLKTPVNCFGVSYRYNLAGKWFPSRIVLGNVYPIEVTAAWILLKYISFILTAIIFDPFGINLILRAFISAFILVSFDFIIDPIAVFNGAWKWQKGSFFFGIPFRNFLGWFLVGLSVSLLFLDLKLPKNPDQGMILPIIIVSALFITTLGRRLIRRSLFWGTLANFPLFTFVLLGIRSVFL